MNITKMVSTHNTSYLANRNIQYIVLHYTAGTSSKAGVAKNIANMFATSNREASADFIVDDGLIVQYNPDIKNRYTWAVGGNKYSTVTTSLGGTFHGKCKNNNSISIEMCSRKTNTKTLLASDTDWYLTKETVNNAIELTKYLMKTYNVPIDHVIMHHHVTGKLCPQPWCLNENRLSGWYEFKKNLIESEDEDMTGEQIYTKLQEYLNTQSLPTWAEKELNEAIEFGITDGSNPMQLIPRYQAAIMAKRALQNNK